MNDTFDMRRLRGILAAQQVRHTAYARACGLSLNYTSSILSGRVRPGACTYAKLQRGLVVLGIDMSLEAHEEVRCA